MVVLVAFFAVINLVPPKKNVENNPFLVNEGDLLMIAAHRGGGIGFLVNWIMNLL